MFESSASKGETSADSSSLNEEESDEDEIKNKTHATKI